MDIGLSRFMIMVLGVLLVGCSDNKSSNPPESLVGAYYSEKAQYEDYSEPETHYVLNDKGEVLVTYIHEITGAEGKTLFYREIYRGTYAVSGSQVSVTDFKAESVCKGDNEASKPIDFTLSFRKDKGNLVLGSGEDSLVLKPLNENRRQKYAATKLCADLDITTENVDPRQPRPIVPVPDPRDMPEVNDDGAEPQNYPTESPRTVVTLPPQIKPVTIRPPSKETAPELVPYIEFDNESWVEKVVDAASIECVDSEECPPFVGLFIGKRRTKRIQMYQCSTTYLGDGYFSTNSHCYHREISKFGRSFVQNCSDEIWVKMPQTDSHEAQTLNCDKIIYLTEMVPSSLVATDDDTHKGREAYDVMIFKVKEQVNRPKAMINFNVPVELGEELTAWTVNPTKDKPGINGVIVKKTCTAYDHNRKREFFKLDERLSDSIYRAAHVNDCDKKMMKGNSGSTLFNKKSQGVAVFSHIYLEGGDRTQSHSGYGTKYTCLGDVNDGEDKIFSGANSSRCRTLSHKDQETIRENLRIQKHNDVVANVRKIRELLKGVYNQSQVIIGGRVRPEPSRVKKEIVSSVSAVSFGRPQWLSALQRYKASPLFKYAPTQEFDKEALGLRTENGQIIFDRSVIGFGISLFDNSVEVSVDDFSVYELQVPSCVTLNREELSRRRTDNRLNPFTPKTYEYDKLRINLPMDVFVADYQFSPRLITDQNIDLISLQKSAVRASRLPFSVYFEVEKSGILSELKFSPTQDLESNDLAKRIKNTVKRHCR